MFAAYIMDRLQCLLGHVAPSGVAASTSTASAPEVRSISQLFSLKGRVAIVSGGASGIGTQMSEALCEAGANVVVCARNAERCIEYATTLSKACGIECVGMGVCRPVAASTCIWVGG